MLTAPKVQKTENEQQLKKSSAVLVDPIRFINYFLKEERANCVQKTLQSYVFTSLRVKENTYQEQIYQHYQNWFQWLTINSI